MIAWKVTLLAAAALLLLALVPIKNPIVNPPQPLPCLPQIASIPPYCMQPKPQPLPLPMEFQKRHLPPPEYDHAYDGDLSINRTLQPQIHRLCQSALKPGHQALGCAMRYAGPPGVRNTCTIWIVTDDELKQLGWNYDIILRHELGHCNGWKH